MASYILPSVIETVDSTSTAPIAITVGQTAQGVIANFFDDDYFTVGVTAGQKYSFGLIGTGISPVGDPYLRILDSAKIIVASNNDIGASEYKWSGLTYTATKTGNLTIEVGQNELGPGGQYGLSVTTGSQFNFDYFMGAGAVHSDAGSFWGSGKGQGVTVTYGFRQTAATYTSSHAINTFTQLSTAEISAVRVILGLWSDVCGITFQEVNPGGFTNNATMLFGNYQDASDGSGAFAYMPSGNGNISFSSQQGDVWLDRLSVTDSNLTQGSYGFFAIMHEIGHAIGLDHPGPYNAANGVTITYANDALFLQDTSQYTVMSYFNGSITGQLPGSKNASDSPMMLDILALQNIYGANMSTRTGNTIYGFGSNAGPTYDFSTNTSPQLCIWDASGTDTLNCSGFSNNQLVDLNAGNFSNVGSGIANVSIALNVTLENAVGGNGNDIVIGNSANNILTGGKGDDVINGGAGFDTAVYLGNVITHTIRVNSGGTTVTDLTSNRDGIDTLTNVERLQLSDTNVALDVGPTQNAGSVYMLYKAAFNRASDPNGMGYWLAQKDSGKDIVTNLAQGFVNSPEFIAKYGSNPANATYVDKLYQNVLGRTGESGGVAYWNQELDAGRISKAAVLVQFATLAEGASLVANEIAGGIVYQQWVG